MGSRRGQAGGTGGRSDGAAGRQQRGRQRQPHPPHPLPWHPPCICIGAGPQEAGAPPSGRWRCGRHSPRGAHRHRSAWRRRCRSGAGAWGWRAAPCSTGSQTGCPPGASGQSGDAGGRGGGRAMGGGDARRGSQRGAAGGAGRLCQRAAALESNAPWRVGSMRILNAMAAWRWAAVGGGASGSGAHRLGRRVGRRGCCHRRWLLHDRGVRGGVSSTRQRRQGGAWGRRPRGRAPGPLVGPGSPCSTGRRAVPRPHHARSPAQQAPPGVPPPPAIAGRPAGVCVHRAALAGGRGDRGLKPGGPAAPAQQPPCRPARAPASATRHWHRHYKPSERPAALCSRSREPPLRRALAGACKQLAAHPLCPDRSQAYG